MKLFSTSCETVFVGWDGPLLPRTVTTLADRFQRDDQLDLSKLLCVLPSARGSHRLQDLLSQYGEANSIELRQPDVTTIGSLAERLYEPAATLALEFEQTLAWAEVMRQMRSEELEPLIPTIPPPEPISPWLELAGMLRRLHEELASSQLTFRDVYDVSETESEKRRWKLLDHIFKNYLTSLKKVGLADPHVERRKAIAADRCRTGKTVVLIGTSDLSDAMTAMLRNLNSDVLSIVAAPSSMAARFDEFGCVQTDRWTEHHLPIEDSHLISAGDVADQAMAVAESLAEFAQRHRADQVTVGVTDESQVGPIEVSLRGCGVQTFRHLGWTVSETAVGRLLDLTASHLQRRTWQSLAALVRHADVCRFVTGRLDVDDSDKWLTEFDKLLAAHFPIRIGKPLPRKAIESYPIAIAAAETVAQWLAVFGDGGSSQEKASIASWSQVIGKWLTELYQPAESPVSEGDGNLDQLPAAIRDRTSMALDAATKLMERFAELNVGLDLDISGAAAIEMLAARLGDARVVGTAKPDHVQILGWLDLALDDAPAMTVVGLNHPFVPGATTSDPFLPGSLRTKLRMADNERRYARDVYAMHLILSARKDIRFIVGKSKADGTPTPPSRLLAATPTEDAARRVRMLLGKPRSRTLIDHQWDHPPTENGIVITGSKLEIPAFDLSGDEDIVKTMSVTAFRDYLACPYRFYLRHVLGLRPLDDQSGELAANQFGDLVHGALERFGESPDRDEEQASKIEKLLLEYLHEYANDFYGSDASTAVGIQVAQAERRLKAVAIVQAKRIADGWKIHASEASVSEKEGAGVDVDGRRMGLRGRFDRIDFHQATGRWAILDYKTHGHKPEKKHLEKSGDGYRWIDLQLPLYRMMVPFLGIDAPPQEVSLGYFNVSEKDEETKINLAEFTEPQMKDAEQIIHHCIRQIWERKFDPTGERVEFDDYSMILQTDVASRMLDQDDSWGSEGVGA
ncbi:MAG: PD-(D/E)XK nuclease family protein [Rubripirellula sp.]